MRCGDCKFFKPLRLVCADTGVAPDSGYGSCARWKYGYGHFTPERNEVRVESDEGWGAIVGPDFGCVLFEEGNFVEEDVQHLTPEEWRKAHRAALLDQWEILRPAPFVIRFMTEGDKFTGVTLPHRGQSLTVKDLPNDAVWVALCSGENWMVREKVHTFFDHDGLVSTDTMTDYFEGYSNASALA